jgi:amino acid transporter
LIYWVLKKQSYAEKEMWRLKGFRWRVWVSIVVLVGVIVFLIYWFWELAEPFNIYQNLAILIVAFLIAGGLMAAMWAPWGMTHSPPNHHNTYEHENE